MDGIFPEQVPHPLDRPSQFRRDHNIGEREAHLSCPVQDAMSEIWSPSYKNLYNVGVTNAGQTAHLARQLAA
jgi:hypothetical protein